jgi:hypothetical protein
MISELRPPQNWKRAILNTMLFAGVENTDNITPYMQDRLGVNKLICILPIFSDEVSFCSYARKNKFEVKPSFQQSYVYNDLLSNTLMHCAEFDHVHGVYRVFLKNFVSVLASWSNKVLTVATHFYSSNNDGKLYFLFEKKKEYMK